MSRIMREKPMEIVDITTPGFNSELGRYFVGQTGELIFGNGGNAWGAVVNPHDSGVNLYFDIFTITNFGDKSFSAEIWLNANPPRNAHISDTVTPSNQAIYPPPIPKSKIEYADRLDGEPHVGTNIFGRIVPPNSTLVSDSHKGSIIVGPGGSVSILLKSSEPEETKSTIVLTWWEEKVWEDDYES